MNAKIMKRKFAMKFDLKGHTRSLLKKKIYSFIDILYLKSVKIHCPIDVNR